MGNKILLNQDKLEIFYQKFGSENFKLQSEMAEDYGKKVLELYHRSIDFIYKTITAIGLVAGFGFTALGYVKNTILFSSGEILLFGAIAIGIWTVQRIYLDEIRNLDKFYKKVKDHFHERNIIFELKLNKALSNDLYDQDINEIQNKDKELISILNGPEVKVDRENKFLPRIIWIIFFIFVSGSVFILSSFVSC